MIDDTRVLSKSLAYSLTGVVVFIALAELLLLTFSGGTPPHYNQYITWFVYLSGFLVTPLVMILATKYQSFKLAAVVWIHVTLGVLLLWFSEIFSPFTATWSLLILFASIYYGWKGFIGSGLSLWIIGAVYCLLFADDLNPSVLIYVVLASMVIVMTILISYLFVRIIMNSRKKNRELQISQQSEELRANQLSALLNSIHDPVLTLDSSGRISSQNSGSQLFFDTNESYVGLLIDDILKVRARDNHEIKISQLASTISGTLLRDDLLRGNGGDMQYVSIQLSRIEQNYSEKSNGVVLLIRDITKQKTLEEEKDEFISVTSHELRTPVAIVEGSLGNMAVLRSQHVDDERLDKAISTAHEQIVNLAQIVNDISMISRAEQGVDAGSEDVDIYRLLSDLQAKYKESADAKSLSLDLEVHQDLPTLLISRLYVTELIENILKNAIKYTKTGGVTIEAAVTDDGSVCCKIVDTGIGISEADKPKIFDKFYRSEDYRTRETGGTGLGLYVAKMLAMKLNTVIEVHSELDKGSTFEFVLPMTALKNPRQSSEKVPTVIENSQ